MLQRLLYLFPWFGTHLRVIIPSDKSGMVRAVPVERVEKITDKDQIIIVKYFRIFGKHYPLKIIKLPTF